MYLILKPVLTFSGNESNHYEAIWTDEAIASNEYLKIDGVKVYRLDALTRISAINVITEDIIA